MAEIPEDVAASEEEDGAAYARLLALQDEDEEAARLRHRLAHLEERVALEELEARRAGLDATARELMAQRSVLEVRRQALERESEQARTRVAQIGERLVNTATSFRDQEAMAIEQAQVDRRRSELDDEQLELMEAMEPIEAELQVVGRELEVVELELAAARERLALAADELEAELANVAGRRAPIVASLPSDLLAEYERLAARLGGVAVARIVQGRCAGCHLALSATELDRIRRAPAGAVFHCEQCGRILVPTR